MQPGAEAFGGDAPKRTDGTKSSPKRPTLQDIANAANVSMMTVSRALKGSPNVSQETRDRIIAETMRVGYRPSFSARTLRAGESRLISILAPSLLIPLHMEIMQGARDAAAHHDYRLMLQVDSSRDPLESPFTSDGDLIMGSDDGRVHDPNRTVSLMGDAVDVDHCGTDLPRITCDMVLYLFSAGYRRIGIIQTKGNDPQQGRLQALEQLGIEDEPGLQQEVGLDGESVMHGVRALTSQQPAPDAIVVAHTAGTPYALEELQRQGFVIGKDIGFVGTEVSHSEWGKLLTPAITAIRIPGYAIGWAGAMRLIERMNEDDSKLQHMEIPSELVIRQSTPGRHVHSSPR